MADLTLDELTALIREKVGSTPGLTANAKIVFDEGGLIHLAGASSPIAVTHDDGPADVTLRMSLATLNKLYRKETNAMTSVMMGKIKIEGNMMLAMQLEKILS
jgi:putative sterol carrier protein